MSKSLNQDILVIGGGIAGMQSALLLAEKNHRVYVLENAFAIGGFFPLLDRTFPTNSCGVCFMSPKPPAYCPIYESDFHENIELLTNCELKELKGEAGRFEAVYEKKPRYVDIQKCTLCNECVPVCPVETTSELGAGVEKRKAIYMPWAQAIPRSFAIDDSICTKCGECVKVCSPGAINLDEQPVMENLSIGAVILGFGFEPFKGEIKGEYGFYRYKDVVSSIQFERMLSFSGPTGGLPGRPSDGRRPKKVAFIQCVGSRDPSCDREYCSSICCMYATKQAMVSKDRDKNLDVAVFYMDIRAMGKDYETYYERAKSKYGIRYIRSMVSTIRDLKKSRQLLITYGHDNGEMKDETFDMVVLSLGFAPPAGTTGLAEKMGIKLDEYNFCATNEFTPTETSVPGIYVAGAFREPGDIPETVVEASSAAADVSSFLDTFSGNGAKKPLKEEEERITDESLRVGIFLCDNKGVLDKELDLADITSDLEGDEEIVCIKMADVTALRKGVAVISDTIVSEHLNRAVIAGYRGMALCKSLRRECTPIKDGFCLLHNVNIGEQCADVHANNKTGATDKAKKLIRGALRKAKLSLKRRIGKKQTNSRILVIGGGIAGLSAGVSLADQGMDVTLVEKSDKLGGNALTAYFTIKGSDVQKFAGELVSRVESSDKIEVMKNSQLKSLDGTWGSFRSVIVTDEEEKELEHGAVIFATGGEEGKPDEYLLGRNDNVVTQKMFEKMLVEKDNKATGANTIVMIQCAGTRDEHHPYCSRVCCSHAVKNIAKLKEVNPRSDVFVLYRDIRTYGFFEKYYHAVRDSGTLFIRYDPTGKPAVTAVNGKLRVSYTDDIALERITLKPDLLVLSTGIWPNQDNSGLAAAAGLALNKDGFFEEANPKAAPLDSVDRGKYFCGLCHSPNHIEDAICQGKAAAARASTLLWKGAEEYTDNQAYVNERRCCGCGLCVTACPYNARTIDEVSGIAIVLGDLCKGCGTCVISCPNGASQQYDYERSTMMEVLEEIMY